MRIGVDIDGVLSKTFELWEEICKENGLDVSVDRVEADESGKVIAFGDVPMQRVREVAIQRPGAHTAYDVYEGARLILGLLAEHDIYLITGRGDYEEGLVQGTHEWLAKHRIPHKEVHFTPKKLERCRELGIDVIIEDDVKWSLQLADGGVPVLLFDKSYNKHVEHDNITRFTHWAEVPRLLSRVVLR